MKQSPRNTILSNRAEKPTSLQVRLREVASPDVSSAVRFGPKAERYQFGAACVLDPLLDHFDIHLNKLVTPFIYPQVGKNRSHLLSKRG